MESNDAPEEHSSVVADGAYCSENNQQLAEQNNTTLVTIAVSGIEVPDIYADFKLNEEGNRVLDCPADYTPQSSCYTKGGNGHIYVSFPRETCVNCPHKDQCRLKVHKKVCSFTISENAQKRARAKRMQGTEQFTLLAEYATMWIQSHLFSTGFILQTGCR